MLRLRTNTKVLLLENVLFFFTLKRITCNSHPPTCMNNLFLLNTKEDAFLGRCRNRKLGEIIWVNYRCNNILHLFWIINISALLQIIESHFRLNPIAGASMLTLWIRVQYFQCIYSNNLLWMFLCQEFARMLSCTHCCIYFQ